LALVQHGQQAINGSVFAVSLFLMLTPPGELVIAGRPQTVAVARARILKAERINFAAENLQIEGAQRNGPLLEFE
jgi:hypothetical protein